MNILTILRDYFPGLIPIFRHLLYRFERVPSLPQEKPARINIGQVSFLWWIRTRKDWWMASKDYAEIEQLIIFAQAVKSIRNCCFWDIGAAQGIYTLTAVAAGASKVISFEPHEPSFKALVSNIRLNDYTKKVNPMSIALGNQSGERLLFYGKTSPSMIKNAEAHDTSILIKVSTIDELIAKGTPSPSIIKIDIEGFEFEVLSGAKKLLSSANKPAHLFVEIHDDYLRKIGKSHIDIIDMLEKHGYKRLLKDEVREGPRYLCHFSTK